MFTSQIENLSAHIFSSKENVYKRKMFRGFMKKEMSDNSSGVVGVVFGILSLFSLGIGGMVLGVVGLLFSIKQKKIEANKWSTWGFGLSVAGIVLGAIATYIVYHYYTGALGQVSQSLGY